MQGPSDLEVLEWFVPRNTVGADTVRLGNIREQFQRTAELMLAQIPPSAHRTAALRDLLHASQSAVFALTHQPEETSHV